MTIPETQLVAWSRIGAQQGSARTYGSIQSALADHNWPPGMDHDVYLQGSYPNHTNIRGDSDVDVVVETPNVFYHNVPEHLRAQYGLTHAATYSWTDFKTQVRSALVRRFGPAVKDGNKCVKVRGDGHRLNADVVPCTAYRHYHNATYTKGITFWTRDGIQIINFPKAHLENGSQKNRACTDRYKPTVRVFKNARNAAENDFPSYFLECLLYNVPNGYFLDRFDATFPSVLKFLLAADQKGEMGQFLCQNKVQTIFGVGPHQTNLESARILLRRLTYLWNNWT